MGRGGGAEHVKGCDGGGGGGGVREGEGLVGVGSAVFALEGLAELEDDGGGLGGGGACCR